MTAYTDGMFYINDLTGDFYLREQGIWVLKGSLRTSGSSDGNNIITGFGPPPSGGVVGQAILVGTGAPS